MTPPEFSNPNPEYEPLQERERLQVAFYRILTQANDEGHLQVIWNLDGSWIYSCAGMCVMADEYGQEREQLVQARKVVSRDGNAIFSFITNGGRYVHTIPVEKPYTIPDHDDAEMDKFALEKITGITVSKNATDALIYELNRNYPSRATPNVEQLLKEHPYLRPPENDG